MRRQAWSVLAYVVATFVTEAVSHFVVNAKHYASIPHIRTEPILAFGILAMLIQGTVLAYLYVPPTTPSRRFTHALRFAWAAGAILVSYMAFAEVAKYTVPNIAEWIAVELSVGFVHFTLYGLLLGVVQGSRRF